MKEDAQINPLTAHRLLRLIKGQVVSEKSYRVTEQSNQYVFKVPTHATKTDIKNSIEYLFEVDVVAVNTLNTQKKSKRFKNILGQRSNFKKAYVTIRPEQKINLSFNE